jgi:hypothetical protein
MNLIEHHRQRYAEGIAAARRPDATKAEIAYGLDLLAARALVQRAWQLCQLPLSKAERQAALGAYREQLDRQRDVDLALLLERP